MLMFTVNIHAAEVLESVNDKSYQSLCHELEPGLGHSFFPMINMDTSNYDKCFSSSINSIRGKVASCRGRFSWSAYARKHSLGKSTAAI